MEEGRGRAEGYGSCSTPQSCAYDPLPVQQSESCKSGGEMRRGWSGVGKGEWGDRWEQRPYIIETMHSYTLPM